jgi:regulator of replication initiation timing
MQEIPKETINELKRLSNHCDSLQAENDKLRLELQSLRSLLHGCTCVPGTEFNSKPIPMEKL